MATTAAPYGLKAVNHIGGTPYAGSTRLLPIASGYAVNIFNGSIVQILAGVAPLGGTIEIVTSASTKRKPIGRSSRLTPTRASWAPGRSPYP